MQTPIETISINETTRLQVFYDNDYVWDGEGLSQAEIEALPDPVGVVLERLHKWVKVDMESSEAKERYEWEEEESIWACYLDETYTAEVVAEEHWGVSK